MRYTDIKDKKASDFKRLTGVKKKTFYLMCDVLRQTESLKQVMGRPRKLSLEDQLLLTLRDGPPCLDSNWVKFRKAKNKVWV